MTQRMSSPTGHLPEAFRVGKTSSEGENSIGLWCLLQELQSHRYLWLLIVLILSVLHIVAQAHQTLLAFYS